jgi:hypothetical protein
MPILGELRASLKVCAMELVATLERRGRGSVTTKALYLTTGAPPPIADESERDGGRHRRRREGHESRRASAPRRRSSSLRRGRTRRGCYGNPIAPTGL